jgi:hypothetical protein
MSLKLISVLKAGFKGTFHERFTTDAQAAGLSPEEAWAQHGTKVTPYERDHDKFRRAYVTHLERANSKPVGRTTPFLNALVYLAPTPYVIAIPFVN